jgi:hypothetical protein
MAWNATGYNENDVEADVAGVVARMGSEPIARGGDNPPLLARRDGLGRIVVPRTRFDLDEGQGFSPPSHDIDLADRRLEAPRRNPKPFRKQQQRGAALRRRP